MTAEDKKLVLGLLQEQLEEEGFATDLREEQEILILRTLVPLLEDGGKVIMEICALDYNEYADLFQIYTSILETPEEGVQPLLTNIQAWNLTAAAGAFGIYEPNRQLYHKYNVPVYADMGLEDKADHAFLGACLVMDEVSRRLGEALECSGGFLYAVE